MAHHNFYESLGLDRSKDSATLASEINDRLASPGLSAAQRDELEVAGKVLGDGGRRQAYDAKLNDPLAPDIDVAALRELAAMDFGGSTALADIVEEPKPRNKPKQYFPETDPNAEAVSPPPPPYQPQYAPPYYPYPPVMMPAPAPAPEKKSNKGVTALLITAILLALAAVGAGGWWLYNNQGEPWEAKEQALADAFPAAIAERNGARGWENLRCRAVDPEPGQTARIRCADDKLGVSFIDYGSEAARDGVLPDAPETVLKSDQCEVRSFEMEGTTPPAFQLAPTGSDARYMVVINGQNSKEKRTNLDLCTKERG